VNKRLNKANQLVTAKARHQVGLQQ